MHINYCVEKETKKKQADKKPKLSSYVSSANISACYFIRMLCR